MSPRRGSPAHRTCPLAYLQMPRSAFGTLTKPLPTSLPVSAELAQAQGSRWFPEPLCARRGSRGSQGSGGVRVAHGISPPENQLHANELLWDAKS